MGEGCVGGIGVIIIVIIVITSTIIIVIVTTLSCQSDNIVHL